MPQTRIGHIVCALALTLAPLVPTPAAAQQVADPGGGAIYELVLKDGTHLFGTVEEQTPDKVVFRSISGTRLEVARAQVVTLVIAEGRLQSGRFLRRDPNPSRLFFGPTGRAIKRGEGYVGVYELFLPFVQVGITDRLSVGGGTPLWFGAGDRPLWLTPKFQVQATPRTSTSVGVLHFFNVDDTNLGIAYVSSTVGSSDNAVTVGAGWAYVNTNTDEEGAVVAMVAGEKRLSPRIKLLTENYVFNGGGILSGGVRFLAESLSADVGLFIPLGGGGVSSALPLANFVWKF